MVKKILIGTSVVIILLGVVFGYGYRSATSLPDNNPHAFVKSGQRADKVVVCIGDSITHGRVSHNYVDELASRHTDTQYSFVNAGINSELAYNVLKRIDEIIRSKPDYITILIGSNDVLASLNTENGARYMKEMKLPQMPDRQWYEENLTSIVDILQQKTKARIALLSLPPVTEDRTHPGYKRAAEYSTFIKALAEKRNLAYLPLNESLDQILRKMNRKQKSTYVGGDYKLMYTAILSHYLLRKSWDDVAENSGFEFLTDEVHLNGRGALMVRDLIEGFLASSP